jgi:transcriptional regulator with XRE-family HTH domain
MKKYRSLGELLIDHRKVHSLSQSDFAAGLNVDIRTVIRWEKDETLVKPDKEEELAEVTFIPYQVIRNLNATVTIPTYYDFRIRKYSMAEISNELPETEWLKSQIENPIHRIRKIEMQSDFDSILRYAQFQHMLKKPLNRELIRKAVEMLPQVNVIIVDDTGYYSGHCVVFSISYQTYTQLKNHERLEGDLTISDLTDFRKEAKPVFHFYDVTADCNENIFYMAGAVLKFFKELQQTDYVVTSLTHRYDSYALNKHLGLNLVWMDEKTTDSLGTETQARFYEGNFREFLSR